MKRVIFLFVFLICFITLKCDASPLKYGSSSIDNIYNLDLDDDSYICNSDIESDDPEQMLDELNVDNLFNCRVSPEEHSVHFYSMRKGDDLNILSSNSTDEGLDFMAEAILSKNFKTFSLVGQKNVKHLKKVSITPQSKPFVKPLGNVDKGSGGLENFNLTLKTYQTVLLKMIEKCSLNLKLSATDKCILDFIDSYLKSLPEDVQKGIRDDMIVYFRRCHDDARGFTGEDIEDNIDGNMSIIESIKNKEDNNKNVIKFLYLMLKSSH